MKKGWLIILALMLVTAMFANGSNRYEIIAWQETFENGAEGWTHYDGNLPPNNWHIYNYGGTQGTVWWMGDPALAQGTNIGGYYNHQYLVLDTPARTISAANSVLTFKMAVALEEVGGTGVYNGWDSFNVRISTNNGATWTVLTPTSPPYDFTSSYAFGFEHNEGPNIPGWGGIHPAWTNATFNLSSYVGQSVKIRFAFASDPAYCTTDDPTLFGVMVDDISFGGYTNNGVDDGQMTWASLVPVAGDLWSLATDPTAPSPPHVMRCQNENGTYNPNMMNYLVSPPIQLPNEGDIRVDFMIQGNFSDPDAFPNCDYWGWEISPNNGLTWYYMSNPYGDPNLSNYVYSDAPPTWASMVASYAGVDGYISDYAGHTIRLRWLFKSDADTPIGTGIMIDDVTIYNEVFIAPPENLEAVVSGRDVMLSWAAPGTGGGGGQEGWLHYDGENADAIGTGSAADFAVAAKWDPIGEHSIYDYVGMNITKVRFFPYEANCTYTIRIWTGATGTLVYEQAVPTPTINAWNEVILTTPFTIPAQTVIMVGYRCNTQAGYPAGCDAGPQVEGYGNMMYWQNSWTTLTNVNSSLTYNWNIRIYVANAKGEEYELSYAPLKQEVQPVSNAQFKAKGIKAKRNVDGYRIYRDNVQIDQVGADVLTYTDSNVPGGIHSYYVTSMYGTNESGASNVVTVFVMPESMVELSHDDGTADQGFNVGANKQMAVKFSFNRSLTVKYAKIYIQNVGNAGLIVRVFDNDGPDGMPGSQLAQYSYPVASLVQGWNYIELPPDIDVQDGQFYIGILDVANGSAIGLDTSTSGNSFKKMGTTTNWEPITEGELMIRAIVWYDTPNDDNVIPVYTLSATNYPNPFNPETTISFSVPTSGYTTLKIYNLKGEVVRTLVNDVREAGKYNVVWNGTDDRGRTVSSGIYLYRLENNGKKLTGKMLLAK